MKKNWKILIIVAVVLGVLAATCPGRQKHYDANYKFMSDSMHEQVVKLATDMQVNDEGQKMLDQLEGQILGQIQNSLPDILKYRYFLIFSLTRMEEPEEGHFTSSFGILGHVFVEKKHLQPYYNINVN